MQVWLPNTGIAERVADAAPNLRIDVWDGTGALPASRSEVEFYVPPFPTSGASVDVMADLPSLRVVQTVSVGVDAVRPKMPAGVTLCNAKGVFDTATAELAVTLTLTAVRRMPDFFRAQADRVWIDNWDADYAPGLADRTVLIVGYGEIGAAIERRIAPFEPAAILRVARTPREGIAGMEQLPELLGQADVVILIVPLTDETRGMVDAQFLRRMRDGALLVNVARGPVVVTADLVAALKSGRISAAVDVTDPEPLPGDSPLWDAPNLVLTPHIAGASTPAYLPRWTKLLREQLRRAAAGEPMLNVVTGNY